MLGSSQIGTFFASGKSIGKKVLENKVVQTVGNLSRGVSVGMAICEVVATEAGPSPYYVIPLVGFAAIEVANTVVSFCNCCAGFRKMMATGVDKLGACFPEEWRTKFKMNGLEYTFSSIETGSLLYLTAEESPLFNSAAEPEELPEETELAINVLKGSTVLLSGVSAALAIRKLRRSTITDPEAVQLLSDDLPQVTQLERVHSVADHALLTPYRLAVGFAVLTELLANFDQNCEPLIPESVSSTVKWVGFPVFLLKIIYELSRDKQYTTLDKGLTWTTKGLISSVFVLTLAMQLYVSFAGDATSNCQVIPNLYFGLMLALSVGLALPRVYHAEEFSPYRPWRVGEVEALDDEPAEVDLPKLTAEDEQAIAERGNLFSINAEDEMDREAQSGLVQLPGSDNDAASDHANLPKL